MFEKPLEYVVLFPDTQSAQRAFENRQNLGYALEEYKMDTLRKNQNRNQPSPTNPVEYIVINQVAFRVGKSLKSKVLGYLAKGTVVIVNELEKQNGRVVERNEDGRYKIVGWVATHSITHLQLLVQLPMLPTYSREIAR